MADFYVQNEYWFAVFQLVTAMFGMGATLTIKDFGEVVTEPKPVSIGFLIQLFFSLEINLSGNAETANGHNIVHSHKIIIT